MQPPPPSLPFNQQSDGRRRLPPRVDHGVYGVFDTLLPPSCGDSQPQRIGCVGVPRSTKGPLPQLAHSSYAGAPYGVVPAYAGLQSVVSFASVLDALPVCPDCTTRAAVFADVDSDRDQDLVLGNIGQANLVLLNDGSGDFGSGSMPLPGGSSDTMAVTVCDANGGILFALELWACSFASCLLLTCLGPVSLQTAIWT